MGTRPGIARSFAVGLRGGRVCHWCDRFADSGASVDGVSEVDGAGVSDTVAKERASDPLGTLNERERKDASRRVDMMVDPERASLI